MAQNKFYSIDEFCEILRIGRSWKISEKDMKNFLDYLQESN